MSDATKEITDDTLLKDVLSSPKNLEILQKNKITTVGGAKALTIADFVKMGVGEVTIEEIRGLGVRQAAQSVDSKLEESANPIHIHSPFPGYCLQVRPGDVERNVNGRGQRIIRPLYIVCQNGRGQLTRKLWYTRKYAWDAAKIQDAEVRNEPWRLEAYDWLRARKSFNKSFRVLSD